MSYTFQEHVERTTPTDGKALIELWTSGGLIGEKFVVTHSRDLPPVYAIIWRLPNGYTGELREGDFVLYPRYAYEVIASGSGANEKGNPVSWELAIANIDILEAVLDDEVEELFRPD